MTALRYALRGLARSPGFVTIAVVALGLGLGLSTTMFAVLDAVINPYVAYREPQNLYRINWWFGRRQPMRPAEVYRYFRDNTHSFEAVIPVSWDRLQLTLRGAEEQVGVQRITPRWFDLMGVRPDLGRAFVRSDGEDVAVVGHTLWRRLFGMRRDINGATLTLGGRSVNIVGVMPQSTGDVAVWMPLPGTVETSSVGTYVQPTVRLRFGVSKEAADRELKQLARTLTERFNAREAPFAFELLPIVDRREEIRDIHKAMAGSALAVLLIACVNLAHLMLARGLAKRREFALRMALGASRGVVVRQMFTECAIMTLGGAALGALIALWGTDLLTNRMPREVSWVGLVRPQLSWRVFAAAAVAAAISAVLFGLLPALRVASNVNLDEPLKDDAGTTTGRVRYRYNPLVVAEVALALVLMMGGGVLLRTVHGLQRQYADLNTRTLLRAFAYARSTPGGTTSGRPAARRQDVETATRGVPGVADMAMIGGRPVPGGAVSGELTADSSRTITMRSYWVVSPSYMRVMHLPILKGRDFEPGDGVGRGVAIVSALAAQRLYPNQDPVGKMLKLGAPSSNAPWIPIVGVSRSERDIEGDAMYTGTPSIYVAASDTTFTGAMIVRTTTEESRIATQLSARLMQVPGIDGAWVGFADESRRANIASRGFLAKVFVTMGVVALGLSMLGLYGVLAYTVGRRMREFAVRVALGASPPGLLRMVLHDGFVMLLAGIGVGAFVALATTRLLDTVLIAVLPSDVVSLVLCEIVLIVAGLAAAFVPARRASRANPMDILRAV